MTGLSVYVTSYPDRGLAASAGGVTQPAAEAGQINQINESRRLRASAHLLIRRRAVVALYQRSLPRLRKQITA